MGAVVSHLPVSVVVVTKNEEAVIASCLKALAGFDDVWVVDSCSEDKTCEVALLYGARVEQFRWNGQYPKKRQWCLDNLALKHDFVFFVDADEILTDELIAEIVALDWRCVGYFVQGQYVFEGCPLKHGLRNNKLSLFHRKYFQFPVVDDLDFDGMGEIEGHYQPCLKEGVQSFGVGQLRAPLLHYAYEDLEAWEERHRRYALWEAAMNAREAWPRERFMFRRVLKAAFRALPFRDCVAFLHCYVFKLGLLDGAAGYRFARSRARYYRMISDASKVKGSIDESAKTMTERL